MTTEQDPIEKAIEDVAVDLLGKEDARVVAAQLLIASGTVFALCFNAGLIDAATISRLFNEASSAAIKPGGVKMKVVHVSDTGGSVH